MDALHHLRFLLSFPLLHRFPPPPLPIPSALLQNAPPKNRSQEQHQKRRIVNEILTAKLHQCPHLLQILRPGNLRTVACCSSDSPIAFFPSNPTTYTTMPSSTSPASLYYCSNPYLHLPCPLPFSYFLRTFPHRPTPLFSISFLGTSSITTVKVKLCSLRSLA